MEILFKIAVLMSTYNGEKYLKSQIDSVINQIDCEVHLLVRDDGSKDNTCSILNEYQSKGDLDWYSGNNIGSAYSFLDLLKHSPECDFYAFCDQDDIWYMDKLNRASKELNKDKIGLYYSNTRLVNEKGHTLNILGYNDKQKMSMEAFVCSGGIIGCTMVISHRLRDIIINHDIPKNIIMHDYYIAIVCMALNGCIIYDSIPSIDYRQHTNNVVGIPTGKETIIRQRINFILHKRKKTIDNQAIEIYRVYEKEISAKNAKFLKKVGNYKKSIYARVSLVFSFITKYPNWKSSLFNRTTILLKRR